MADIYGIGVDVVDIDRIADLRRRHPEQLTRIIFTQAEVDFCLARANPDEALAARFAAKEAVMKALGTGWAEGVAFTGIEVLRNASGAPEVRLLGSTLEKANSLGIGKIHISLSHSKTVAMAQAVAEKKER